LAPYPEQHVLTGPGKPSKVSLFPRLSQLLVKQDVAANTNFKR